MSPPTFPRRGRRELGQDTPRAHHGARNRRGRALALLLVGAGIGLALGLVGPVAPAGAHAQLVNTDPADGARLTVPPTDVTLTFSENISVSLGQVRVLDSDGDRVDRGGVTVTGQTVTVPLRSDLPDGTYVVAWRAVSADSHPIHGAFTFGVGDASAELDDSVVDALVGQDGEGLWRMTGTVSRVLAYGGALLATGLALFLVMIHDGGPERSRLRGLVRVGAGAGVAGILIELPVRAALATGLGPDSITSPGVLEQILADNVGVGMALAVLALLFVAYDAGRDAVVTGAGLVAVSMAFAIAGHTATSSPLVVAIGADAAHVAAAAVWLGGLVGLLVVVTARRRAGTSSAALVLRFSGVAAAALGAVAVAGAALGWTQVGTIQALVTTPYGQLLMAKVAIVGLVAALGGWNRYRLVPLFEEAAVDGPPATAIDAEPADTAGAEPEGHAAVAGHDRPERGRALTHLRRTLMAEVALLVLVVAVTAVLVDVTPARQAVAAPFSGRAELGDGEVIVDLDPTRAGRTTMHIYTYDAEGNPWDLPEGIEITFSLPTAEISGLERVPPVTGPGHWTLIGDDLSIAGTWMVEVAARTSLYEEETARFQISIVP